MPTSNTSKIQQIQQLLITLAAKQPNFADFHASLSQQLPNSINLPAEISQEIISVLNEDTTFATAYQRELSTPHPRTSFAIGTADILFTIAALYFLQSKLRIKRDPSGKWEIEFLHKPTDNTALIKVVDFIKELLHID
jgi:hypothetical protein